MPASASWPNVISNQLDRRPMTKFITTTLLLFLIYGSTISQTCEKYNRKLFNYLPAEIPDKINCKDINGKKQGWWIYYELIYNSIERPEELGVGYYIPEYIFGKYENDIRIGKWHTRNNVHNSYDKQIDEYYYSNDSVQIQTIFSSSHSVKTYLKDSTIIKSYTFSSYKEPPLYIECNKDYNKCKMTYRNKFIKVFPFEDFELEYVKTFFLYDFEKSIIDAELK